MGLLRMPLPNERGFALLCPWQKHHSKDTGPSSTALLYPSEENNYAGAFKCLHQHCAGRRLGDLVDLLRRVTTKERAA